VDIDNIDEAWLKIILAPKRVVCSIQHSNKFEIGISMLEAELVKKIIMGYYKMVNPSNKLEETRFWTKQAGVVAPHNAQGKTIINGLFRELKPITHLDKDVLMNYLKNSVNSVEKFQGSDRDMIITSIGLSDVDKISDEVDFIFDINRFNVLTSRAKSKLIFIASKEILNFIPDERKLIESSSKFDLFVNKFCNKHFPLNIKDENNVSHKITFRYKQ
jgi:superfamily I DNA and/or RNA helicase